MTKQEIRKATKMLANRADRVETIAVGSGGQYLTAYWLDGGQTLFCSLEAVVEHVGTH